MLQFSLITINDEILIMIHKPQHPGAMVKALCLEPLDMSVTAAAQALKVSRTTLSRLLNGKIGISSEMAMRLAIVFNTAEEFWINLQAGYDLWKANQMKQKLQLTLKVLPQLCAA
jgi:addiction module HigA family antidote